jgi:GAF domain-containing protein
MGSHRSRSAAADGSGHAGGGVKVPAGTGDVKPSPAERSHLSQSERAKLALEESRRAKPVPIERAYLEAALDFRQTLRVLVSAMVPRFADWCFVDLLDGEGIPRRVEVAHADPAKAPLAHEMRSISFGPGWATPAAQAIRDRAPRLYRELTSDMMTWATHDERHLAVLRAIRPNSLITVPLVARDRAMGALTLIRSAIQPPFDENDLLFTADVAGPSALALDNARRVEAEKAASAAALERADVERDARIEAEKSVLRLRRLESVSASLSSVLSPQAIARVACENGLSALEPSSTTVVRVSPAGDLLEVVHADGWPDDLARELRQLPADAPALVAEAYRIQTAIWVGSEEALAASHPNAVELARRIGDRAFAAVPLRADGRTLGAIGLGFPRPRDLDGDERRYVLTVAQLVAQALERSRLRDG